MRNTTLLFVAAMSAAVLGLGVQTASAQAKPNSGAALSTTRNLTVTGIVVDELEVPMPGVNVTVKGTTLGVATDGNGNFKIPELLAESDVLVFSFIGYRSQEYTVKAFKSMGSNVRMEIDTVVMGEVIVCGGFTEPATKTSRKRRD